MKTLIVFLNKIDINKIMYFQDKKDVYILNEILHIPISLYDWENNCYKGDKIIDYASKKLNNLSFEKIFLLTNLKLCNKDIQKTDKIELINVNDESILRKIMVDNN
ncbi:hypothetical protein [Acidianus sp. HS-5]|uniref:hypothetical protein n=1 Tax=Acidianus sp. HS-5 TaxID=2886040 RepID=UPI001F2ED666|nr:hypothetical protein [Acidianus sp. HS-5]BDC19359.1 hypothetical protein HS5_22490 [Acidianus sp. HS-5]